MSRLCRWVGSVAVGFVFVTGCGDGSGGGVTADGELDATNSVTAQAPGPDAELVVEPVPTNWSFLGEERPETERGNTVILQVFEGPEVDVPNPGGPTARLGVTVFAAHVPGLASSGRAQDLATLAPPLPDGFEAWTEERTLEFNGVPAIEVSRPVGLPPVGPAEQRMIVMVMGEWKVTVTGDPVPADVQRTVTAESLPTDLLEQFAKGVRLG